MRRKESTILILIFLLPLLFLSDTLLSEKTFFMRDLTYLFHPWRSLSSQMIQQGVMPLWNPYQMGGMPFLANCQSAILYPFTTLFALFTFTSALKLFHFFHYALCSLGLYLFARKMNFRPAVALAGSIVFSYNGYLLTRLEFLSVLGAAVWFAWILLFFCPTHLSIKTSSILAGLTFSLAFFSGFPQILILQILGSSLFVLFTNANKKSGWIWVGSLLFLMLISTAQWLPTLELLQQSVRANGNLKIEEAASYSLPMGSLFGCIVPYRILHHPDRFTGEKFFWIWSAWCGLTAFAVSLLSIFYRGKKLVYFAVFLAIAALGWAMGNEFQWFEFLFNHLFLARLFRYPPVVLYWFGFAISILTMCGLLKLNLRASWIVILFLSIELWVYSRNLLPTITPDYYRATFRGVESVLRENHGAVLLSPKLEQQRRLAGMSSLEAMMRFRAYCFDLTNLPYRIKTLVPSGEPLALQSYQKLYWRLSEFNSLEKAMPILNFLNVTHFLSADPQALGWQLVEEDRDLKVYRNLHAAGDVFALDKENINGLKIENRVAPQAEKNSGDKIFASFHAAKGCQIFFNVPFYPGWKLICANCPVHAGKLDAFPFLDYLHTAYLPPGKHDLYLSYQPSAWKMGISITTLSLMFLIGWGLLEQRAA